MTLADTDIHAEESLLAQLAEIDSATLHEAAGRIGALDPSLKPLWPEATVVGRAFTARCHPGDNLAIHRAVAEARPGDVLVVDAGGHLGGYWGEVLGVSALARGVRGLVIDGGVRDAAALQRRGFPVWARGVSIQGMVKVSPGTIGERVVCGGVEVRPGDWIVGDRDGVVAIPRERVRATLDAARQRVAKETKLMAHLAQGELTLDLLDLREVLRQNGIR